MTEVSRSELSAYLEQALSRGIPAETAVRMLASEGWPERAIYAALASNLESATGLALPKRASSGASAKDAFFYLLIFASLATWTFASGCLAFTLLDRWLPDPLFPASNYGDLATSTITSSVAAIRWWPFRSFCCFRVR